MGKVVHYHPVSLTVLRGMAIHGGFQLGRIVQTEVNTADQSAMYRAYIIAVPWSWRETSPDTLKEGLSKAFSGDVSVLDPRYSPKNDTWSVVLSVCLRQHEEAQTKAEDLRWLSDETSPDQPGNFFRAEPGDGMEAWIAGELRSLPF